MKQLITQRPEVVAACEQVLAELMDTTQLDQKRAKLQAEQARITERMEAMMARASREVVEDFTEQYAALEAEMNRVTGKLDAVKREKGEREYREDSARINVMVCPPNHVFSVLMMLQHGIHSNEHIHAASADAAGNMTSSFNNWLLML